MATSFNVVGGNGLSVCLEAASLAAALVLSILLLVGNKTCYSQSYHFNLLATQTPENAFFPMYFIHSDERCCNVRRHNITGEQYFSCLILRLLQLVRLAVMESDI